MYRLALISVMSFVLSLAGTNACATEDALKSSIKESFFDPDAVKFGRIVIKDVDACVEVNGKNRFGGYVGKRVAMATQIQKQWFLISVFDITIEDCLRMSTDFRKKEKEDAESERVKIKEEQARKNEEKAKELAMEQARQQAEKKALEESARQEQISRDLAAEQEKRKAEQLLLDEQTRQANLLAVKAAMEKANSESDKGVPSTSPKASTIEAEDKNLQGAVDAYKNPDSSGNSYTEKSKMASSQMVLECAAWLSSYAAADANLAARIEKDEWSEMGFFATYSYNTKMRTHPLAKLVQSLVVKGGGEAAMKNVMQQSITPEVQKILLQVEGDYPKKQKGQRVALALPMIKVRAEDACERASEKGIRILTVSDLTAVKP